MERFAASVQEGQMMVVLLTATEPRAERRGGGGIVLGTVIKKKKEKEGALQASSKGVFRVVLDGEEGKTVMRREEGGRWAREKQGP